MNSHITTDQEIKNKMHQFLLNGVANGIMQLNCEELEAVITLASDRKFAIKKQKLVEMKNMIPDYNC